VPDGVKAARSFATALVAAAGANIANTFVVGGAQIFTEAFANPALRYVYLTRVLGRFDCDTQIPNLDAQGFVPVAWDGACEAEDNGVRYRIERLSRA
jgi:dihydrofolate reductase